MSQRDCHDLRLTDMHLEPPAAEIVVERVVDGVAPDMRIGWDPAGVSEERLKG